MNLPSLGRALCGIVAALALLQQPTRAETPACVAPLLAYAGTEGAGLHALRVCDGALQDLGAVADVARPRWLLAHGATLYVASDPAGAEGQVLAFGIDRASAALQPLNAVGSGGAGATHLALDAASQTLLAANFSAGSVASFAVEDDGRVGARVSLLQAMGSGPHKRQASAHAHGAAFDPTGRFVLVPDLGADRVFVYGFDRTRHALQADPPRALALPPGSGPRRAVFGRDGRHVHVLNELSAEIVTLGWTAGARLAPQQTLALNGEGFQGTRSASELLLSADGRFAYAADRGEGALRVYGIDADSGRLSPLQSLPSGGDAPWALAIDASGRWLLVANLRSRRIHLFRIDPASGRLSDTGQSVEMPGPLSLAFVN